MSPFKVTKELYLDVPGARPSEPGVVARPSLCCRPGQASEGALPHHPYPLPLSRAAQPSSLGLRSRQSAPRPLIGSPGSRRPMGMTSSRTSGAPGRRKEVVGALDAWPPRARGWQRAVFSPGRVASGPRPSSLPGACGCWRPGETAGPVWAEPAVAVGGSPDLGPALAPCSIPRNPRARDPSSAELGPGGPGVRGHLLCRTFCDAVASA